MNLAILLLASGRGRRMGSATPKVYLPVGGIPILVRSFTRLRKLDPDAEIILAVHPDDRDHHLPSLMPALEGLGLTQVVAGGETRQESMERALAACSADREVILVHDAARPFFPVAAAKQAIQRAQEVGAALLAVPAPDTMKRVDSEFLVTETVDRDGLWLAQTPQVVRRDVLDRALAAARADGAEATDDVSLVERLGLPVEVVPSSPKNLKITVAGDLEFAHLIAGLEDAS